MEGPEACTVLYIAVDAPTAQDVNRSIKSAFACMNRKRSNNARQPTTERVPPAVGSTTSVVRLTRLNQLLLNRQVKSSNSPWPGIEMPCQVSTAAPAQTCEADTGELCSLMVSQDSNAYRSLKGTGLCFVVTIACRRQLWFWNPLDRLHNATEYWLQCRISMCLVSTFETVSIRSSPINLHVNLALLEAAFRRHHYRRFIRS